MHYHPYAFSHALPLCAATPVAADTLQSFTSLSLVPLTVSERLPLVLPMRYRAALRVWTALSLLATLLSC